MDKGDLIFHAVMFLVAIGIVTSFILMVYSFEKQEKQENEYFKSLQYMNCEELEEQLVEAYANGKPYRYERIERIADVRDCDI